jgi:hypothetical protein
MGITLPEAWERMARAPHQRFAPTSKSELRSSRRRKCGARQLLVRFARPRKPDKIRTASHEHYHRLHCLPGKIRRGLVQPSQARQTTSLVPLI